MTSSIDLAFLLHEPAQPFALMYRPGSGGSVLDLFLGEVAQVDTTDDFEIALKDISLAESSPFKLIGVMPYRQIGRERGYACHDDSRPLLMLTVAEHYALDLGKALKQLPDDEVELSDVAFDIDDNQYADIVRRVVAEEIGSGEGANFVIKRSLAAKISGSPLRAALATFRRLVEQESGSYWVFLISADDRFLVGATPERHVSLDEGVVTMNPISGTFRYPASGATVEDALIFLKDRKEVDELLMVVDEELKMMSQICDYPPRAAGPYLKEMRYLAHTEFLLSGPSSHSIGHILRTTMFAPTVTGSPLENACNVIKRYETRGRSYYSGVVAIMGDDGAGRPSLDSAVIIRTAEIGSAGELEISVGATIVRHSDPSTEVIETHAKLAGLLGAISGRGLKLAHSAVQGPKPGRLSDDPSIRAALANRIQNLGSYWLAGHNHDPCLEPNGQVHLRVLLIDGCDNFGQMLRHQLLSSGYTVTVRRFDEAFDPRGFDLVIVGPGPGDPRAENHVVVQALRSITYELLHSELPFLSLCLGHQILCSLIGFEIVKKGQPNQGRQRDVILFGQRRLLGYYNTFAAFSHADQVACKERAGTVWVTRDVRTGEVDALVGPAFASIQFHPESILSKDGLVVLQDLLTAVLSSRMGANRKAAGESLLRQTRCREIRHLSPQSSIADD